MVTKKLDPVHPGEILQKKFLEPAFDSDKGLYYTNLE